MRKTTRQAKVVSSLVGLTLIAAACGSSKTSTSATTPATVATTAAGAGTTTAGTTGATAAGTTVAGTTAATAAGTTAAGTTVAGGSATTAGGSTAPTTPAKPAMTITMQLDPKAVWDDGTPITVDDFKCTVDAVLHTTGSLSTVGWDQIISVEKGKDAHEIVATLKSVYAPYKNLFSGLLEKAKIKNCSDVSTELQDSIPFSARPYKLQAFSKTQATLVANDKYWGSEKPIAKTVVMVPEADTDTEIAAIKSGEVAFDFPQAYSGITDALTDPNIKFTPGYGTNFEDIFFNQQSGPFADATFRQAFAKSFDRNLVLKTIYNPIFPGAPLLNCGVWVPTIGKWCNDADFKNFYDPTAAAKLLTDAGWKKGADGFWADKTGKVPTIRWIINTGNKRRENTQALMIPEFAKSGFKVVADNCDSACYFQKRLPALDYDMAMYITTASPDPTVTSILACDSIPSAANNNAGQNTAGWCDKDASALMKQSDAELDLTKREDQIHQIGALIAKDAVLLPLFQFPNIAAWRTDKLDGPIDADAANYQAFQNIWAWKPKSGDTITIGAEQWPDCLNPITECANSSWYEWLIGFKLLPNVWDTTGKGDYAFSSLVSAEPVVKVLS